MPDKLRKITGDELIEFGKDVRKLAENPYQRKLDEARAEFKRRNQLRDSKEPFCLVNIRRKGPPAQSDASQRRISIANRTGK